MNIMLIIGLLSQNVTVKLTRKVSQVAHTPAIEAYSTHSYPYPPYLSLISTLQYVLNFPAYFPGVSANIVNTTTSAQHNSAIITRVAIVNTGKSFTNLIIA